MIKKICFIILFTFLVAGVLLYAQGAKQDESEVVQPDVKDEPKIISIISPVEDDIWMKNLDINIKLSGYDYNQIRTLEVYLDGQLIKELKSRPFKFIHNFGYLPKNRILRVVVRGMAGILAQKEVKSYYIDDYQEINITHIVVPVAVKDRNGYYVSDLKKDDFLIYEDGVAQEISFFDKSSRGEFNLVLLIDISSSMKDKIGKVKETARMFLEQLLSKNDKAIVVFFNHDVFEDTEFTSDMKELKNSISVAFPFGATALYDAIAYSTKMLKAYMGRNIIILLSDGEDNSSYIDPYTLMKRVERSNIEIYSIGNRYANNSANSYHTLLKKISLSSGGMLFLLDDIAEIEKVYRRIRQDIRSKYVLQFSPNSRSRRKRFRKITVKIKNKKSYQVRTIKGFYY